MTIVVAVAALVLAAVVLLIIRELRSDGGRTLHQASAIEAIPRLYAGDDNGEVSMSTALTLFEGSSDLALEEPTGRKELITVTGAAHSDRGLRSHNEDSFVMLPSQGVYAVADGMGGAGRGDVASRLAVDAIEWAFQSKRFAGTPNPTRPRRGNELVWAIEGANRAILETARVRDDCQGMGATVVGARFSTRKQRVYIGHVGDSRCYRWRGRTLTRLTVDHTLSSKGVIGSCGRRLRRALGARPSVKVDLLVDTPQPGDKFLLCSDGLPRAVPEEVICDVLARCDDLSHGARMLVAIANSRGCNDNVTVVLMAVQAA